VDVPLLGSPLLRVFRPQMLHDPVRMHHVACIVQSAEQLTIQRHRGPDRHRIGELLGITSSIVMTRNLQATYVSFPCNTTVFHTRTNPRWPGR
jgi:hypothetical protein